MGVGVQRMREMHQSRCAVIKEQIKLISSQNPCGNIYQGQHRKSVLSVGKEGGGGPGGGIIISI